MTSFRYRRPADIFREHAALSAFENDGRRIFDIGALAELSDKDYEGFYASPMAAAPRRCLVRRDGSADRRPLETPDRRRARAVCCDPIPSPCRA